MFCNLIEKTENRIVVYFKLFDVDRKKENICNIEPIQTLYNINDKWYSYDYIKFNMPDKLEKILLI